MLKLNKGTKPIISSRVWILINQRKITALNISFKLINVKETISRGQTALIDLGFGAIEIGNLKNPVQWNTGTKQHAYNRKRLNKRKLHTLKNIKRRMRTILNLKKIAY